MLRSNVFTRSNCYTERARVEVIPTELGHKNPRSLAGAARRIFDSCTLLFFVTFVSFVVTGSWR